MTTGANPIQSDTGELVVEPATFETAMGYEPASAAVTLAMGRGVGVEPWIRPLSIKGTPLCSQLFVMGELPVVTATKTALLPSPTVMLAGCCVTEGGMRTVRVALEL